MPQPDGHAPPFLRGDMDKGALLDLLERRLVGVRGQQEESERLAERDQLQDLQL
ncbi:hypothetical protein [Streptomyces sp. NPDC127092]|uniref:hypothetical protein n=1 Tax=Streptomyces sp. NPDC127092 TaxID=3347135 RepID=UPI00364A2225